jgi:CubicO group peptidase (beta-lactamase class C family)
MFVNNGSSLLSPRSIAEMKIVVGGGLIPYYGQNLSDNARDIPTINAGLGWYWQKLIDGQRYIGHTGSLPGAVHWMFVNEKSSLGVIILTNGDANTPNDRSKVIHKLFESIHLELIQCFETNTINSSASKINVTLFRFSTIALLYFHQIIILLFFNNFQDE